MMKNMGAVLTVTCAISLILSCASQRDRLDVVTESFPEAQAELQAVLKNIYNDAMNANTEGLKAIHLNSTKFTKFGPRSFERQNVEQTNDEEAAFFSSISELEVELKDVKIDVFDDVAIATFYPVFSLNNDGQRIEGLNRQTMVFLKTGEGWKIIHEHGTPKK